MRESKRGIDMKRTILDVQVGSAESVVLDRACHLIEDIQALRKCENPEPMEKICSLVILKALECSTIL